MDSSQQNQKVQIIGLTAAQKKGTNQSGRRPTAVATATKVLNKPQIPSTSQSHQGNKGEEGKKRSGKDKKKMEKNGKAANNADLCAELGRDSPNIVR